MLENKKREFESRVTARDRIILKTQMLYGRRNPAYTIIEYANKEEADLIIIGSIGLGGFSKTKALVVFQGWCLREQSAQ